MSKKRYENMGGYTIAEVCALLRVPTPDEATAILRANGVGGTGSADKLRYDRSAVNQIAAIRNAKKDRQTP